MKTLFSLFIPSLKAFIAVIMFMFTVVSASYIGVVSIARTEARNVESKFMAVRQTDIEHLDKRFDRIEKLIKEIK